jgi:hypothetical protein
MAGYGRGALRGAADGMSNLARSLLAGPAIQQQAGMQEAIGQSRIAQAMAAAQKDQADADLLVTKNNMLGQRPGALEEQVAVMSGTDLPLVRAVRESIRTGRAPQIEMAGPTEDGSPLMGDLQVAPEQRSAIAQALQRLLPVGLNTGDIKVDDWASALGNFGDQDLRGDILAGRRDPKSVALAQRAMKGGEAYAPAEYGVTDLFTGKVDATGAPAQRFGQYRDSTTAAQKANAVQSYAAADNSRASAQKTRAETDAMAPGAPPKPGAMSVALQKELLEADDTVQSAAGVVRSLQTALKQNDAAYSGYLAKPRAVLRSNLPGGSEAADATIDIDNLMTGQGLESLKSIFGAAPTEGERKILIDMQASVDKTPAQRKAIMERAMQAAERRAAYTKKKAAAIRSGRYLTEGIPEPAAAPAPTADPAPVRRFNPATRRIE